MTETDALVERVAREMCIIFGRDPDQLRPATGYENAEMVPMWWMEREWAARHIAAARVLTQPIPDKRGEDGQ